MLDPESDAAVTRFDAVTEDPGEIDRLTEQMFGARVRVERSDGLPLSLRLGQIAAEGFGVQRVTWNVDGRCDVAPLDRFLCIRLRRGSYGLDQGGGRSHYTAGDTFLVDPDRKVDAEVVAADLDSITIERSVLEEVAGQVAPWSRHGLDFRHAVPVSPRLGAAWDGVLDHVAASLHDDAAASSALVRAGLRHLLAATACAAFGLVDEPAERPAQTRAVRRAIAFMDEHLAEPITVGDAAAAAGLSVRGLQAAFRRMLGTTPNAYLRGARLDAARRDLVDAGDGTAVADIALRWGFAHLGRFAGAYRDAFGELPSTTLRS